LRIFRRIERYDYFGWHCGYGQSIAPRLQLAIRGFQPAFGLVIRDLAGRDPQVALQIIIRQLEPAGLETAVQVAFHEVGAGPRVLQRNRLLPQLRGAAIVAGRLRTFVEDIAEHEDRLAITQRRRALEFENSGGRLLLIVQHPA
jgi:hypothetical protein